MPGAGHGLAAPSSILTCACVLVLLLLLCHRLGGQRQLARFVPAPHVEVPPLCKHAQGNPGQGTAQTPRQQLSARGHRAPAPALPGTTRGSRPHAASTATPRPRPLTADAGRVPPARRHRPHGHAGQGLHQPRLLLRLQAPVAELPVPVGRCTRTDGRAPPAPGAHSPDAPRPPAAPRLCSSARATAGSEGTGRPGHGCWWYTAGTGGAAWCSNYVQRNDTRHNCNITNVPPAVSFISELICMSGT